MSNKYPPVGIYEHYKSTSEKPMIYQLVNFVRHTETEEVLALYTPLYRFPDYTGPTLQVRPLDMFIEDVEIDGKTMPRFRYLGPELSTTSSE